MNFEPTGIAVVAFSGAVGVVIGWALCHLGHARVRADARHFKMEADTLRAKAIRFDEQRLALKKDRDILVAEANLLRSKLGLAPMNEVGDLKTAVEARERELAQAAELAEAEAAANESANDAPGVPGLPPDPGIDQAPEHDGAVVDLTGRADQQPQPNESQQR